ncbi:hypothetical protein ZIOFF_035569 [Zingiber officinale]|uniref:Protein kinase domain-containing protein n=1 Tax=Zingiber officinale TaxID=94328 RepID=A0A8J5KXS6_ZINOF|nr:hypothetical protein ZIOFF_035569 [Zingiber officinale]
MASSSKALGELLRSPKRLRPISLSPKSMTLKSPLSTLHAAPLAAGEHPSALMSEQAKRAKRVDAGRSLSRSKRNLSICSERIATRKGTHSDPYVKLGELLVEETWLEALLGELQKPYAQNLCRFVEMEMRGSVPIYPPPHLIFNALHLTSFDEVKAVIIGQIIGGRYSEEDAKAIVIQILSVIAFCHLQGVVHRDLKPEEQLRKYHPTRVLTIVYQPFALVTTAIFTYHEAKVNTRLRNLTGYILFFLCSLCLIVLDVATFGKGGIGVYIGICVISAAFGLSDALVEGGIVGDLSMMSPEFLQALLQNATESMKESKVIDILNVAKHPFLLPFFCSC